MKPTRLINLVLVASGAIGSSIAAAQTQPFPLSPPTTAQGIPFDPLIQSIRQAPDPSSAVNAFAAAQGSDRGDVGVEGAYLRRMVEFGLPEMADVQAQDLIRRESTNGLAWGVAAYMSAKRGDMTAAATQADAAIRRSPEEPFVIRTAAQTVAWYDLQGNQAPPGDAVGAAVESIRRQEAARPQFVEAYQRAKDALLNSQEPPAAQLGAQPLAAQPPTVGVYPPPLEDGTPDVAYQPQPPIYISPAPYPAPYYYPDPYVSYYGGGPSNCWYPSYYSGCPTWWPTFGGFLFINTGHNFHHGFHDGHHDSHDGHHDGGHGIAGTGSGRHDGVGSTGVNRGVGSSVGSSPVTRAGTVSITPSARADRPVARTSSASPDSVASRGAPRIVDIRPTGGARSSLAAPQSRGLAAPTHYSMPSHYSMPAPSFSNSQSNFGGSSPRFSSSPSLRFGGSSSLGNSGPRFSGSGGSGNFSGGSGGSRGSAGSGGGSGGGGGHR